MKKTLLATLILIILLGVVSTAAFAQSADLVAYHRGGGRGPFGDGNPDHPLHPYMVDALAAALKMDVADVETALADGKTQYGIALAAGIAEADIPALLQTVHETAFTKAVADGVITQDQADRMLARMAQHGYGNGDCTGDGTRPMDGTGAQFKHGGRMGGRGQQQPTP